MGFSPGPGLGTEKQQHLSAGLADEGRQPQVPGSRRSVLPRCPRHKRAREFWYWTRDEGDDRVQAEGDVNLPATAVDQRVDWDRNVELGAVFPVEDLQVTLEDLDVQLKDHQTHGAPRGPSKSCFFEPPFT